MLAYTKPIYNWWEQRRFVYDTDLNKKSFIMDTTVEQMNIGGFRENSIRTVRIIGAMNRVIQDVSIKNPFMEFKISNLEEVDFMN